MNIYPSFTTIRSHLTHQFFTLRTRARRASLWARLTGRNIQLALFPEEAPEKSPNRRFIGTEDIPVEQIVGTLSRQHDFDHRFRPLKRHLCERWINAYLALQSDGWPPILVHKVGENYYVEDGHHRVSVAQILGLKFIQAKVWEYPCLTKEPEKTQPESCPERSSARVFAGVAD